MENLKYPECSQTRKCTIQHPTTKTDEQRSEYFGQRIGVDVLMNPNRIITHMKDLTNQMFNVSKTDSKNSLPTTIILEEYEVLNAFEAPYAIVFEDECSRWNTVIPLKKTYGRQLRRGISNISRRSNANDGKSPKKRRSKSRRHGTKNKSSKSKYQFLRRRHAQ